MKRIVFLVLSVIIILGIAGCSQPPAATHDDQDQAIAGEEILTDNESASTKDPNEGDNEMSQVMNALKRGLNIKTAFEPEYTKFDCSWVRDVRFLEAIKDADFDHIRIPVWINSHIGDKASGYKIDEEFLNTLDEYVALAEECGFIVVIDYHDADALFTSKAADEATEIFYKVWEQLSTRFAKYPDTVIYELINEPKNFAMTDKLLAEVQLEAYNIIRKDNPTRPVVFAPNDHNAPYKLNAMELPSDDPNIIVSVHTYAPFQFTHQQLREMGADYKNAVPYSQEVENDIMSKLDLCKSYIDNNNVKLWLSEFGMSTFIDDTESVEKYLNKITTTCNTYGISYCYWAFGAGIGQDFSPFNALTQTWKDFVVDNLK